MSIYTIKSPEFPGVTVTVDGNRAVAYGVAESIFKQQKVEVTVSNDTEGKCFSFDNN